MDIKAKIYLILFAYLLCMNLLIESRVSDLQTCHHVFLIKMYLDISPTFFKNLGI